MIDDILYSSGHGKECSRDKLWSGRPARTGTVGREPDGISAHGRTSADHSGLFGGSAGERGRSRLPHSPQHRDQVATTFCATGFGRIARCAATRREAGLWRGLSQAGLGLVGAASAARVGGESGPGARSMDPAWVKEIRDQCFNARVPFFFKQWGGTRKKKSGRELD